MLSMVAVHKERMVSLVSDKPKDGLHRFHRDGFLFCALDVEDDLANAILQNKGSEFVIRLIFLNQSSS